MNKPKPRAATPKRILIVDDEPLIAEAIQMILRHDSHKVEIADNALVALAMFSVGRHDLVITDLRIPGLSGVELAREIRELQPRQPIVCITGDETQCDETDNALFSAILAKPLTMDKLRAAVCAFAAA